jgi:hypothetical protein
MAKKKTLKVERISIMPDLTPEKHKQLAQIIDRKGHLEYLCYMMLNDLDRRLPLRQIIEAEIKRDGSDESLLVDFFTEGHGSVEGFTIPSLLKEWRETTDQMVKTMAGRA